MVRAPNSINELAPGGRVKNQRMCKLVCLNDSGIGCVCAL